MFNPKYNVVIFLNYKFHKSEPFSYNVFLSIHTATPSLEDYEQAYIVHTGFAGWKPTSNHVNYCRGL